MFDVGFWELALLAVIGLIVLGPERLPVVARTAGRWIGRVRSYAQGLTNELDREVDVSGFREEIDRARQGVETGARRTMEDIESETRKTADDVEEVADDLENGRKTAEEPPENDADSSAPETAQAVDYAAESEMRSAADDLAEYGEEESFSLERARAEHAQRDSESRD